MGLPPEITAAQKFVIVGTEADSIVAKRLLPQQTVLWPSEPHSLAQLPLETWMAFNGLDVLLWPTNTPQSKQDMTYAANSLSRVTDRLRMLYLNGEDEPGFRPASMFEWTSAQLVAWAKTRARPYVREEAKDPMADLVSDNFEPVIDLEPEVPRETNVRKGKPRTTAAGNNATGVEITPDSAFVSWEAMGLDRNGRGEPHANFANVQRVLAAHPDLSGRLWYDEFHDRVFSTLFSDEPEEWADHHDTRMTIWLQSQMRLSKMGVQTVQRGVDEFARLHPRNEPKQWMESLSWDGTKRLDCFLPDAFGTDKNVYTAAVGRCWMISMVARIFQPGAKVDYMPVFEGSQGMRKSTALYTLGGKWFAETHEDITSKDFLQNLRGKMLIEFSELHAFKRAEIERIKGIITCRNDRYRESYGRRSADRPRQCVFAGTTNRDDWVQDDTGARRFWPVSCREINTDYIRDQRDQLFAEAVTLYRAGSPWWDIDPALAKQEQDARRDADVWTDAVLTWASLRPWVVVGEVLSGPLDIKLDKQGRSEQMRVASILRLAGWTKKDKWIGGRTGKAWCNPQSGISGSETRNRELDF